MEKLVFVTRNMKAGGAERVISQLANNFSKEGIQCTIVTLDNEEIFYQLDSTVKIYPIGRKSKIKLMDKILKYRELRIHINREKPDVVLALPEEIGVFVLPSLIGTKIPVVVSERNNPWLMPCKKETRFLRNLFYPFASGFVFQTKQAASFFSKKIQSEGIVLPNPLDLERIPEPWVGQRRKEVVGVGRLDKQKNFPLLISAFAKFYKNHSDYVLTIYGEGSLGEDLEILAASLLLSGAYSFPGSTNDLMKKINGADMFVLSSDYEGMPNVVIEAMAMGMPVISTDCPSGGPAELIDNGITGLLVPIGDVDAMSDAMSQLADSEKLKDMLGKNAQDIKNRLDSTIVGERWRRYLDAVSKKKNTN